jgi:hypothetical protein
MTILSSIYTPVLILVELSFFFVEVELSNIVGQNSTPNVRNNFFV